MGGVRFVSIVMAIAAFFLWGGFVVNSWQNNQAKRDALAVKTTDTQEAVKTATLDRADEMAIAASQEFSKFTDQTKSEKTPSKTVQSQTPKNVKDAQDVKEKDVKEKAVVAARPVAKDEKPVWTVPTANDPIDVEGDASALSQIATDLKDGAQDAVASVGQSLSSFAEGVKDSITGQEDETQKLAEKEPFKWRVPDGVTPGDVAEEASTKGDAKETKDRAGKETEGVKVAALADEISKSGKLQVKKSEEAPQTHIIDGSRTESSETITGKTERRLADEVDNPKLAGPKDTARLSKDLVAVPVEKYAAKEAKVSKDKDGADAASKQAVKTTDKTIQKAADQKTIEKTTKIPQTVEKAVPRKQPQPVEKAVEVAKLDPPVAKSEVPEEKPIWVVPTGKTPEFGLAEQIERGLDTVKEAASKAGSQIAEGVSTLGDNVKDAVASAKTWEVPTGVTWGDDKKGGDDTKDRQDASKVAETKDPKAQDKTIVVAEAPVKKEAVVAVPKETVLKKEKDGPAEKPVKKAALPKETLKTETPEKTETPAVKGSDVEAPKTDQAVAEENEVFVSNKVKRAGHPAYVKTETKDKNKGDETSVVSRIIDFFSDKDKGAGSEDAGKRQISSLEKARSSAIKKLMVEDVDYTFTNRKKGQGVLKLAGRSQAGSKLALYVGPRYLGDVTSDKEGNWAFEKKLYLSQGQHIVHAQQMSKGGSVLARKTKPFVQKVAGKAPKGYNNSIGISQGDKGLAFLKNKLRKDREGPKNLLMGGNAADAGKKPGADKGLKKTAALSKALKAQDRSLDGDRRYIVKSGDTLTRIAHKVYGDARLYKRILKLNPRIKNAHKIYPRMKLLVGGGAELAQLTKSKSNKAKAKPKTKTHYIVRSGDSLWIIAKKVYGNAGRYKELIALNPGLAKNPRLIQPKMKLRVSKS